MSVIQEVKERLDLVDVVSGYVALKKAGQNYKALCPFHTEKTPSFVVFPETQTWHCFGACGTGGDVFTFIERVEGVDFGEALRMLAERAGVELAPRSEVQVERAEALDRLREINAAAARYFHHLLIHTNVGATARAYLENRGIGPQAWETFELGYARDDWEALLRYLTDRGYALEDVAAAGLIVQRRDGSGYYDRFRGRLMFPIRDVRGHVIGFGARALKPGDEPKYLNSPQTPIFDKSHVLYGLDRAHKVIRRQGHAVIVEGYTDVITAHTHGFENVVASLGTALTETQLRLLKRYTRRFVLALDADTAGTEAMLRGLRVAQEALETRPVPVPTASGYVRYEARLDAEIRILVLPPGLDPDDLIRRDANAWLRGVEAALPVVEYVFDVLTADLDLNNPKAKSTVTRRLLPVIAEIGDPVERAHYLQKLARLVQVDERVLADQLRLARASERKRRRPDRAQQSPVSEKAPSGERSFGTEEYLLASILDRPEWLAVINQGFADLNMSPLNSDDFVETENRALFEWLQQQPTTGNGFAKGGLAAGLPEPLVEHVQFLRNRWQLEPSLPEERAERAIMQTALRLRERTRQREIQQLRFLQETAATSADAQAARDRARQRAEELRRLHRLQVEGWKVGL